LLLAALALLGALATLLACYSLGQCLFRSLRLPQSVRFALGAVVLSFLFFLLLILHLARDRYVLALLSAALLPLLVLRPAIPKPSLPRSVTGWLLLTIGAVYGVYYFVNALAPEIQPDGITYHLGLVRQWLLANGFPPERAFYYVLPQGLEVLFVPAYVIGQHSAAKLVHFGFLVATVPLLFATARRLGLAAWQAGAAAVLYLCAPVVGIAGTASYNDAALVFFILVTFYLTLSWDQDRDWRYALAAGLTAGFCYALKPTGLLIAPLAVAVLLWRRQPKAAGWLAAGAGAVLAPWLLRNALWTGNPLAPLLNTVFENPYFHTGMEDRLAEILRSYGGVTAGEIPLQLTVHGDKLQGLIGPVFLLVPLALLALRHRAGRLLLAAAAVLALPWMFNFGVRFAMPALLFLALSLVVALPRPAVLALAVAQAILCLPPVMDRYAAEFAWRLKGLPVAAALRVQPEQEYLGKRLWQYEVAELVEREVPARAPVFDLLGAPQAYFDARAVGYWQSAANERLTYVLYIASMVESGVYTELEASWPATELTALRLRLAGANTHEWSLHEVELYRGRNRIAGRPGWLLSAWPNVWDAPLAFDGNLLTRWTAWEHARPGMYVQVQFPEPTALDRAKLTVPTYEKQFQVDFIGRDRAGKWRLLAEWPRVYKHPAIDLRRSATAILKRNGIDYILAPEAGSPFISVSHSLFNNRLEWGVELVGTAHAVHLFRIR